MRRVLTVTVVALLATSIASARPAIGRQGILLDVHGYDTGHGVVVPMRGIAEWMGATVEFRSPHIHIALGPRKISMKLGSSAASVNGNTLRMATPPKRFGDTTCVPVRFVGEALDCQVRYVAGSQASGDLVGINHVRLDRDGSRAIVLVHGAAPDTVAGIVKAAKADAAERGLGFGQDYIVWVEDTVERWASAAERWWDEQEDGSSRGSANIYQLTPTGWVHRCATSRGYVRDSYLRDIGVPVSVARRFGWEVFDG